MKIKTHGSNDQRDNLLIIKEEKVHIQMLDYLHFYFITMMYHLELVMDYTLTNGNKWFIRALRKVFLLISLLLVLSSCC